MENFVENSNEEIIADTATEEERSEDSFSEENSAEYRKLKGSIRLYFLTNHKIEEADRFISYNEKRRWRGSRGENVKEDFRRYAQGWMDHGEKFYEMG